MPITLRTCQPTPEAAELLARDITRTLTGHAMHKAFDRASNEILRGLGFGEFVAEFERATEGYHDAILKGAE
jgi:hypothetical protein